MAWEGQYRSGLDRGHRERHDPHRDAHRDRRDRRADSRDLWRDRGPHDSRSPHSDRSSKRESCHDGGHARDFDIQDLGDFVSRRLVPELRRSSGHPVILIINRGALFVGNDSLSPDGFGRGAGGLAGTNGVLYNAPRSTMVLGAAAPGHRPQGGRDILDAYDLAAYDLAVPYPHRSPGFYHGGYRGAGVPGFRSLCPVCGLRLAYGDGICRGCEEHVAIVKRQSTFHGARPRQDHFLPYSDA